MNGKRWIGWIAVLAFVLAVGWPARADSPVANFVGVWAVKVTPDEETGRTGKLEFRDQLLFEGDGNFTAEAFGPMGFAPTLVAAGETEGSFTCTTDNDSQGTIVWTGTCTDTTIDGTMTWTKPDGSVCRYTFHGTKKS